MARSQRPAIIAVKDPAASLQPPSLQPPSPQTTMSQSEASASPVERHVSDANHTVAILRQEHPLGVAANPELPHRRLQRNGPPLGLLKPPGDPDLSQTREKPRTSPELPAIKAPNPPPVKTKPQTPEKIRRQGESKSRCRGDQNRRARHPVKLLSRLAASAQARAPTVRPST